MWNNDSAVIVCLCFEITKCVAIVVIYRTKYNSSFRIGECAGKPSDMILMCMCANNIIKIGNTFAVEDRIYSVAVLHVSTVD
ncbi:hypothetical protein ASJ35_14240 [Ruthenibacterium lactatiformans]|uniref:Uncharacterized protein n=1 Tax=Ruthenibacterium lactatiformans TaxID=1550024 RepID=A0A0W7TNF1_9FIRM|nr:hypothetical protein ASJ35_14240 [Ruthenibacterium lactatiformans]